MTGFVVFHSSQPTDWQLLCLRASEVLQFSQQNQRDTEMQRLHRKIRKTGDNYMYAHLSARSLVLFTITLVFGLIYLPARAEEIKSEHTGEITRQDPGQNPHSFTGTWIVQTQITNCSGATLENFSKLLSINAGGTAQEMSNSLPPSQRTTAFGVWQHSDHTNFVYALRFFRFTPTGTFANTAQAKWSVVLAEDGQSYTAGGAIQIALPNGTVVANLCGTETGTRMVISD
jgi:hypothetical protein